MKKLVTLLVFLKAMSGIIAGQVAGAEAQDPGDPPVSINISSDGEEPPEEQSDEEPPAEGSEEPSEDSEVQTGDEDAEDTTPPIRVNESQDIANLRKKVRRMMLRG